MGRSFPARVTVAGAGALGTATALALARAGAAVTLADPGEPESNASAIAAGMLAPAFEAALDPAAAGHFPLLKAARDLWPTFIEDLQGAQLFRDGAEFVGARSKRDDVLRRLEGIGAQACVKAEAVFTPEDWRLEPAPMLAAMQSRLEALGGRIVRTVANGPGSGEALVVACGYGGFDLAPELAALAPIKGQLLAFEKGPKAGPIVRSPDGYLVPTRRGAVVGATMRIGEANAAPDPADNPGLLKVAERLAPGLAGSPFTARAGVRAATPDGLPLVGRSRKPGVWIAAGARRNGWLLAPLIAQMLVAQMQEEESGEWTALFDPARFDP